jgi:hypothetical protein
MDTSDPSAVAVVDSLSTPSAVMNQLNTPGISLIRKEGPPSSANTPERSANTPERSASPGISLIRKEVPPELREFLSLCMDINLTLADVDEAMGYEAGTSRKLLRRHKTLAVTVNEGRVLAMREAGYDKVAAFKKVWDLQEAKRTNINGDEEPDNKVQLDAAKAVLGYMGEVSGSGAKVGISLTGSGNKILVLTSEGNPAPFPMRDKVENGD